MEWDRRGQRLRWSGWRDPKWAPASSEGEEPESAFFARVEPDDAALLEGAMRRAAELGEPFEQRFRARLAGGLLRQMVCRGAGSARPLELEGVRAVVIDLEPAGETVDLAALVESSGDAIVSTDCAGLVTSWNDAAERIFGFTKAEMLHESLQPIIPPEKLDEDAAILLSVCKGEFLRAVETTRRSRSGALLDVSITASPIRGGDGVIVGRSTILRDITALKTREREVARLSRLYSALSQINQSIVKLDARQPLLERVCSILTDLAGFRLAWVGWHEPAESRLVPVAASGPEASYAYNIKVYTDARPEGRGPTGTAFREDRLYVCNDLLRDSSVEPWRAEMERRGFRSSAVFPIREGGVPVATLSVYATEVDFFRAEELALLLEAAGDIGFALEALSREKARAVADSRLRSEQQFSERIIESMPGILYLFDDTGRMLRWSRSFETVSGYSDVEIGAMRPVDFFEGAEKSVVADRIAEAFVSGESSVEADFKSKTGVLTPYFLTGRSLTFMGARCLVGVGIDISERMRAEAALRELTQTLEAKVATRTEELRQAATRAESADRLKSAFLATMSHELRTPLNSIIGFTGILLQGLAGPLNEEQLRQLGMVRSSARHLLELINDVLDLSKIEAEQLEVHNRPFDLPEVIRRAAAAVEPLAKKKGLPLVVDIAPTLSTLHGDARRVEQILLNLLNNAVKFTDAGQITLSAMPKRGEHGEPVVVLDVRDTGIGIKPEDLETLFRPFRQLDTGLARQREGTGLGLVICRRLADLLGGRVSAESTWSVGSVFTLTLPAGAVDEPTHRAS
ncbi:MAG: PAS domain S-box protein [Polyangiaceae bacterium]